MKNSELQRTAELGAAQHSLVIQESGSTVAISSCVPAALEDFYVHPFGKPGHSLENLFYQAARLLRASGVAEENIQSGLIILSVVSSIKMEMPLSIMLHVQQDTATAEHLLSVCKRFIDHDSIIELSQLKPEEFFSFGNHFQGRVIVCRNLSGVKKAEPDLKNLIINGKVSTQTTFKSKYGPMTSNVEVHGPVAFIGIEKEDDPRLFDHPSIIRVPVSEGFLNRSPDENAADQPIAIDFEMDRLAEYIGRFRWRRVSIPYERQLSAAILRQRPEHYIQKNGFLKRLLAVLTIMNNTEPIDKTLILAKLLHSQPEHVQEYLRVKRIEILPVVSNDVELVSGKVEYFFMKRVLGGIIPIKHESLSLLRRQILNIVKSINFKNLNSSILGNDNLDKMYTLNYFDLYWAKIELIFKRINKGRESIISIPVIETKLAALKKKGFIERKKFKDRDEYGYFILTLDVDEELRFPEIVELFGACSEEQHMEVINPITGQIEKI
jgi:hypothetical protein